MGDRTVPELELNVDLAINRDAQMNRIALLATETSR
jgi:hypothetical protein